MTTTAMPELSALLTLLSTHCENLSTLYSTLSRRDPASSVRPDLARLELVLRTEMSNQTDAAHRKIDAERAKYALKADTVDKWLTALGEPARPRNQDRDGDGDERSRRPLDELVAEIEEVLDGLRSRIQLRAKQIVEIEQELHDAREVLGDVGVRLDPRDRLDLDAREWEQLDLTLERLTELTAASKQARLEIVRRQEIINECAVEISSLHKELGPPTSPDQLGTDGDDDARTIAVVSTHLDGTAPIVPTLDNVTCLERHRAALEQEQRSRHATIQTIYDELYHLWTMLGVDEAAMDQFVNEWCGSSRDVVEAYQTELDRMLHLRRSNLARFIQAERDVVSNLWDESYVSHDERVRLFPAFATSIEPVRIYRQDQGGGFGDEAGEGDDAEEVVNDNVTEDLLQRHERYRAQLELDVGHARPVLARVAKYFDVVQKGKDLEAAAANPARLTARGSSTILLLEERDRKRVAKEKPKLEAELREMISGWESTHRTRFLVDGMPFLETLDYQQRQEEMDKENKRRAKLGTSASTTTRPLRAQQTGGGGGALTGQQNAVAVPLKRQMTGASARSTSSHQHHAQPPPAKRQVAMTTGSSTHSSLSSSSASAYYSHSRQIPPTAGAAPGSARNHHPHSGVLGASRIGANHSSVSQPSLPPATPAVAGKTGTRSRAGTIASNTPSGPVSSTAGGGGGTSGMRLPTGWGTGTTTTTTTTKLASQRTGGAFRPRPSTTSR